MIMDVVAIVFICTAMNHMGLIGAIEREIGCILPVISCVKCSTFWATFVYLFFSKRAIILPMAAAFILSYLSLWLELLMGYIDSIYVKFYEKITINCRDEETSADAGQSDTSDTLSDV